jgi:hypothetical protein
MSATQRRSKFNSLSVENTIKETFCSVVKTMQEVQKSRTTPIKDSIETVPGYPVQIYLIPASSRRNARGEWEGIYQARTVGRMKRKDGTIDRPRESMKTKNRATAIRAAKEWYNGKLLKQANGEPLVESPNFKTVAESLFLEDQGRVDRGEHSQSTLDNDKSIYNSALIGFFGQSHCRDINYTKMQGYITWCGNREDKKALSSKTINNHLIVLSKILAHAVHIGFLKTKPEVPMLAIEDNPRGWFTDAEYISVRAAIDKMTKEETKVRYVTVTQELQLLAAFMLQTYLRPGDLPLLQHKHIQLKQTAKGDPYLLVYATSKTKDHYAVAMPEAIGLYSVIKALHPGKNGPEDYVFFPQFDSREHAMSTMTKQFTEALKLADLKFDHAGKDTPYLY